ncbi:MAG: protease inhibitor I42 family protein [Bacteroidales bacterium]|nr:protease inhibitor I42 family protein [Bacteroidales bacterium]MBQ5539196.1 protease inhibitor I42 family protein [Bacteroidales bacterium]MBR4678622.1 protease inhibitor I42 family protein [Bacteroidales bacterium]MEE3448858.1 protease inhibitor I42 family protein [Bacteroidales bacterium]
MKKNLITLILMVLTVFTTFSSCKPQKAATTTNGGNPMSFSTNGSTVTVVLEGNTTTGYSWGYKIKNNTVAGYVSDEYKANNTDPNQMMVGAGGKHTFVFKALKQGTAYVTFDYAQHWKKGNKAGVRMLMIMVDDKLNATAAEVKRGE